jgi:hypothetical protein
VIPKFLMNRFKRSHPCGTTRSGFRSVKKIQTRIEQLRQRITMVGDSPLGFPSLPGALNCKFSFVGSARLADHRTDIWLLRQNRGHGGALPEKNVNAACDAVALS